MVSHEENTIAAAIGHFEYRFEGGGLVTPHYKYVYLETGQFPILPIFKGRDTDGPIRESGLTFSFDTFDFWGSMFLLIRDIVWNIFCQGGD